MTLKCPCPILPQIKLLYIGTKVVRPASTPTNPLFNGELTGSAQPSAPRADLASPRVHVGRRSCCHFVVPTGCSGSSSSPASASLPCHHHMARLCYCRQSASSSLRKGTPSPSKRPPTRQGPRLPAPPPGMSPALPRGPRPSGVTSTWSSALSAAVPLFVPCLERLTDPNLQSLGSFLLLLPKRMNECLLTTAGSALPSIGWPVCPIISCQRLELEYMMRVSGQDECESTRPQGLGVASPAVGLRFPRLPQRSGWIQDRCQHRRRRVWRLFTGTYPGSRYLDPAIRRHEPKRPRQPRRSTPTPWFC